MSQDLSELSEYERAKWVLDQCSQEFPPELIGKLPKSTCQDCSKKRCNSHIKQRCNVCGAYMTTAHMHVDFVGHAQMTARIGEIDPAWQWEPFALDDNGLPFIIYGEAQAVLWINLTIGGVTRPGVGLCDRSKGSLHKELIGDALRNAGMRFGLALKLWAKEDQLGFGEDEPDDPEPETAQAPTQQAAPATQAPQEAPAPQESPSEPQEAPEPMTSDRLMRGYLTLNGEDAKNAQATLTDAGFWPIAEIADESMIEAAELLAPIVIAARDKVEA